MSMHPVRLATLLVAGLLLWSAGPADAQAARRPREMPLGRVVELASVVSPDSVVADLARGFCFPRLQPVDSARIVAASRAHDPVSARGVGAVIEHIRLHPCSRPRGRLSLAGLVHKGSDYGEGWGYGGEAGASLPSGWGLYGRMRRSGLKEEAAGRVEYDGVLERRTYSVRLRKWMQPAGTPGAIYLEAGPVHERLDFTEFNHDERWGGGAELGGVLFFTRPLGLQVSAGVEGTKATKQLSGGEEQPVSDVVWWRGSVFVGLVFQVTP